MENTRIRDEVWDYMIRHADRLLGMYELGKSTGAKSSDFIAKVYGDNFFTRVRETWRRPESQPAQGGTYRQLGLLESIIFMGGVVNGLRKSQEA